MPRWTRPFFKYICYLDRHFRHRLGLLYCLKTTEDIYDLDFSLLELSRNPIPDMCNELPIFGKNDPTLWKKISYYPIGLVRLRGIKVMRALSHMRQREMRNLSIMSCIRIPQKFGALGYPKLSLPRRKNTFFFFMIRLLLF